MMIKYRREERPKGDLNKNTYFLSLTIQIIRSKNETRSIENVMMGKKAEHLFQYSVTDIGYYQTPWRIV